VWRCQAALGLGVDGLPAVNSTTRSRLWKWSGRAYADDTQHAALADDNAATQTSQRDGIVHFMAAVSSDWVMSLLAS